MMMEPKRLFARFGEERHFYVPTHTFYISFYISQHIQPHGQTMTTGKKEPPQNNTAAAASEKKRAGSPRPAPAAKKERQVRACQRYVYVAHPLSKPHSLMHQQTTVVTREGDQGMAKLNTSGLVVEPPHLTREKEESHRRRKGGASM